jgi:hypothetical protein
MGYGEAVRIRNYIVYLLMLMQTTYGGTLNKKLDFSQITVYYIGKYYMSRIWKYYKQTWIHWGIIR